jgi:hypothetical protein
MSVNNLFDSFTQKLFAQSDSTTLVKGKKAGAVHCMLNFEYALTNIKEKIMLQQNSFLCSAAVNYFSFKVSFSWGNWRV